MAHAYLILVHQRPEQAGRLIRRLLEPGDACWVHVDLKVDLDAFRRGAGGAFELDGVHLVERVRCEWGRFGVVEASLNGIRAALASGHPFTHLSLLSGQDYPIRPPAELKARLAHDDRAHLEARPLPGPGPGDEMARVTHRFFWLGGRHFSLPNRYTPFLPARRMPAGLVAHKGAQWWTLPHDLVVAVDRFAAERPEAVDFFRRSLIPDESMIPSILASGQDAGRIDPDTLRAIVFEDGGLHPKTLTVDDLPALRATGAFFARKFDEGAAPGVLDAVDRELLGVAA